jgi:DNA-3-methyladenine glycosylase II
MGTDARYCRTGRLLEARFGEDGFLLGLHERPVGWQPRGGGRVGHARGMPVPSTLELTTTRVDLPGPLHLADSLEPLRRPGDDLVDRWDGVHLVSTVGGEPYVAAAGGDLVRPWLEVTARTAAGAGIAAAVAARFAPAPPSFAALCRADPVLGALDARFPGVRTVRRPDLLAALIHCISAQQVNLAWAATTRRRLAEAFGDRLTVAGHAVHRHSAERLAAASVADLRRLQLTGGKAAAIVEVAGAVAGGRVRLAELAALPDAEVVARLTALRGIGVWSAEWVLARTLGRPVVVSGDLGVRRAVGAAYLGGPLAGPEEVRRATAHWGDAANPAQQLLLHALAEGALGAR